MPLGPLCVVTPGSQTDVFGSEDIGLGYVFSNINTKSLALEDGLKHHPVFERSRTSY